MKQAFEILLLKLKELHEFLENFYQSISCTDIAKNNYALRNTASVLCLEEKRYRIIYENIINELKEKEIESISDQVLAKVDFFLITLKQSSNSYGIYNAKQLMAQAIDSVNKQVFLLKQILELIKEEMNNLYIEEIFHSLIQKEEKYIENLKPFLI